jgi:hypothetical protein
MINESMFESTFFWCIYLPFVLVVAEHVSCVVLQSVKGLYGIVTIFFFELWETLLLIKNGEDHRTTTP